MKRKGLLIIMCLALLTTGCDAHRGGVPQGEFKSVSYSTSGMDRSANVGLALRMTGGAPEFCAELFIHNIEFSVNGAAVDAAIVDRITSAVTAREMLARRGKQWRLPKLHVLDDGPAYFRLEYDGEGETASTDDGYAKPASFYEGRDEIRGLLYELAEGLFDGAAASLEGGWTSAQTSDRLEFSFAGGEALCRESVGANTAEYVIVSLGLAADGGCVIEMCALSCRRELRVYTGAGTLRVCGEAGGDETVYAFDGGN